MKDMKKYENIAKLLTEKGIEAEYKEVVKDGVKKDAMVCKIQDSVSMVVYLDPNSNATADEEATSIIKTLEAHKEEYQEFPKEYNLMFDWNLVKDRVHCKLVPVSEELKETRIYLPYLDLAKIYLVSLNENAAIVISKEVFEKWNVSLEELDQIAIRNTERDLPLAIHSMSDVIKELIGTMEMAEIDIPEAPETLIFTNRLKVNGAAVILYESTLMELEKIAAKAGSDLFIIPSSKHELIINADGEGCEEDFKTMIKEVNDSTVSVDDLLSYSLYKYDRKKKEIVICA